ncbi:uncharacterized protein LOC113147290 [Cyclospora cayetanensis]|nr:uncharacterized protein LOC113147290 [Cyclospora cayetanensis]
MDEALVCVDTDGSGAVEFTELLAASLTLADLKAMEPTCSVAFRLLDRNVDGFVSANDLLSILHFDPRSDLEGVLFLQRQRADAAVAAYEAAAAAAGVHTPPAGALLDETDLTTGRDEQGQVIQVPLGASHVLQLEGVTAATAPLYVQVLRELKAIQPRASGLWNFEEFMKLL